MSRARAKLARLVVVLACVGLGCRGSGPSGGRAGAPSASGTATGSFGSGSEPFVASARHDFGQVTQGDTLRHVFTVHNRTSAAFRWHDMPEVLGCRTTAAHAVLGPGEHGKLEVTCRADVPGPLRVSLPLRASARSVGELSVVAEVEPLLEFDPRVVEFSMPFGEERSAAVRLRGKRAREARLDAVAGTPPVLEATVFRGAPDKSDGVALRARGSAVGSHAGSLRYSTGLATPREVSLPYVVKVTGTLAVTPTNPVLELGTPGPKRAIVTVTSTQRGFVVTRAEVLEGPFAARVRRAGNAYEIEVTVVDSKLPVATRGVNGRMRILSNDRTEGAREISLFGLGRPLGAPERE